MNLSTVSSLFKKTMQREKKIICDYYDTQKKYEVFFRRDNRSTSPQGKMRLYYENSQGIQIGTIYNYKNKNYLVVSQDAQESEVYYTSLAVSTEFTTVGAAYKYIEQRIGQIKDKITSIPEPDEEYSCFSLMYTRGDDTPARTPSTGGGGSSCDCEDTTSISNLEIDKWF